VTRFEVVNLARIRGAVDAHNSNCPVPARAILLNPTDHQLLGWAELWGLPVLPDDCVPVKRVRIDCDGSAWNIEREIAGEEDLRSPSVRGSDERGLVVAPLGSRRLRAVLRQRAGIAGVPECRSEGRIGPPIRDPRRIGAEQEKRDFRN
jgi:hypothetical protein